MSMLSSFLHPERGYEAGQGQLNNYYGQSQGYLNPYNQGGIGQLGNLQKYIEMLMNPGKLEDEWNKSYKESESAHNAGEFAQEHGLNAASSMGLLGSNTALDAIQAGKSRIQADDKQSYLDRMMQKYLAGAGISQGLYNTGAGTATNMSNNANQMGSNSAQMSYGRENAPGNMLSGLLGLGGSVIGSIFGGGRRR